MVISNLIVTSSVIFMLYLVGSIPTGYWFCKYFFHIDITSLGSGNIGATNVARVLGSVRYFFIIFFIDAVKAFTSLGLASVVLGKLHGEYCVANLLLIGAIAVFCGNSFSIFLGFKGGKGVATLVGLISYLLPLWVLYPFFIVWSTVLYCTRAMYLASLSGAFVMVASYWFFYFHPTNFLAYFLAILLVFLIIRHKKNIIDALNHYYW